jgi:hypothetical protein
MTLCDEGAGAIGWLNEGRRTTAGEVRSQRSEATSQNCGWP